MTLLHFRDNSPAAPLADDLSSSATTCTVEDGTLVGMPTVTPWPATIGRNTVTAEQITVTNVVGNVLTITRDANGQGAFGHAAGDKLEHTANAAQFGESSVHINSTSGVHGVTGDLVGTTDEQTLSNKTFEAAQFDASGGVPGLEITAAAHTDNAFEVHDATNSDAIVAKIDGAGKLTAGAAALGAVAASSVAATGNVTAGGTLGVTGNATVGGSVGAASVATTGNANVGGNETVAGSLTVTGNISALTTMTVHQAVTLNSESGTTTIKGATTVDDNLAVTGNETVAGTLGVTGVLTAATDVKSHGIILPLGTIARVTFTANGNTAGTSEVIDSGIPVLTFTALGSRRVKAIVAGRGFSGGVDGSRYAINIRDGGASNPTKDSPLFGNHNTVKVFEDAEETFFVFTSDMPTAGTHKLGVFYVQLSGSGLVTPVGAGEFMVEDAGAV